jgi:hypothetical protein
VLRPIALWTEFAHMDELCTCLADRYSGRLSDVFDVQNCSVAQYGSRNSQRSLLASPDLLAARYKLSFQLSTTSKENTAASFPFAVRNTNCSP